MILFDQFKDLNVVIVGDVMIDHYLHGVVNRISPEAPVPIVEVKSSDERLGGAANVALNIKALGATPYLFSVIGDDTEGDTFLGLLEQHGINANGIIASEKRQTTVKTRIMAGAHQMLRLDSEMKTDLVETDSHELLRKIHSLLEKKKIHAIILQDYNKGVLCLPVIQRMMLQATKRKIPCAVDPKKNNFFEYKGATLFKPNLKEIKAVVPFDVTSNLESLQRATDYLRTHLGHQHTMITLSEKGLFLEGNISEESTNTVDAGNSDASGKRDIGKIFPTQSRNISDVSGAGDTVISVAALGLAAAFDSDTIALLSNLAGGQVCESAGVVSVDRGVLQREFDQMQTAKAIEQS
jgi:D-glycero-beta-D-manno-heptose-7-phosphate kinase